jgi:MFS family permease
MYKKMIFGMPKIKTICSGVNSKSQLLFLLDGILINGAYTITTGIILSGYVIFLSADDFLTALLNNSANYTTILSLFSFVIFERMTKRKNALLVMNFISRIMIFLVIILPLVFHSKGPVLLLLTIMVIISNAIWGVYRVGWMVWMMSVVPRESKSDYIYLRTFLIRLAMSLITIAAGFVLDIFDKGYTGFLIVFAFSFILSISDVIVLKNIGDTDYEPVQTEKTGSKMFFQPVFHREYRSFLLFIFLFYLGLTMASSFTPVYLIKYLKFDYSFITTANVISQVAMIASNLYWARVEKKKGFRFVLGITALFTIGELLVLSFLKGENFYLLFISTIISGIGMGGFGVSIFTYRYEIMPETGKTIFEGWFYFASGLGMLIAPFAGQAMINFIPEFSNPVFQNSKMQLLYLISFVLLCILLFFTFVTPSIKKPTINGLGNQPL